MPDHIHLLVQGLDKDSHLTSCMTLARRRSALTYRRTFEADLWQDGYFDRVVRDADDERGVIRYIVNNPGRWWAPPGAGRLSICMVPRVRSAGVYSRAKAA